MISVPVNDRAHSAFTMYCETGADSVGVMIPVMAAAERPQLVIVGRPNVGKSTLFNRITHSRRSITGDEPGITRDRIRLPATWNGKLFEVTDTGGMTFSEDGVFTELIGEQVRAAAAAADRVVFVIDGRSELTPADRDLAGFLRRLGGAVTVAVNKCDTEALDGLIGSFYELGFTDVVGVSAEHGRGIERLLKTATKEFPRTENADEESRPIRVAIIGRPNAGKSTLLNRITGQGRAIVSAVPGTTRDAVDAEVIRRGRRFVFVDTAGIRRKGKTTLPAEKLSVVMARRHLRLADAALLLVEPLEGVTALDANIAGYAHEAGKACVIVVNKWDSSETGQAEFRRRVREQLKFLNYAPVAFISALTGDRIENLFPLVLKGSAAARRRIPTAALNRFLAEVNFEHVTVPGYHKPKISYVTQAGVAPPTFVFFTNRPEPFHFGLERYLINRLRDAFGFEGTPIVVRSKLKRK